MFNEYMEKAKKYVVEDMHISMDSRDYDKIKIEDIARTMVTVDLLLEQKKTNELLEKLVNTTPVTEEVKEVKAPRTTTKK